MGTAGAMKAKLRRVPTSARPGAVEELQFAHALEECLQAIERGETDLDGLAARYPDAAAEIRSLLSVAQELREKRVSGTVLSLEFKEEVRNRLLQRMER